MLFSPAGLGVAVGLAVGVSVGTGNAVPTSKDITKALEILRFFFQGSTGDSVPVDGVGKIEIEGIEVRRVLVVVVGGGVVLRTVKISGCAAAIVFQHPI